jgi:hypothetical protein
VVATNNVAAGTLDVTSNYSANTTGSILTATDNITDADGKGTVTYKWQTKNGSSWDDISGATASTYTLTTTEAGKQVRALASFTDDLGANEAVGSTPTAAVVKDYVYYKVESSTADSAKVGVYVDTTLLTGTQLTYIRAIAPIFDNKTGAWRDNFELVASNSKYAKYSSTNDGSTYNDSEGASWGKSYTTLNTTTDGADTNKPLNTTNTVTSGWYDLTGAGQYKMGEIEFNPKTATIGKTLTFTFDPGDASSLAHSSSSTALNFGTYDFNLVF